MVLAKVSTEKCGLLRTIWFPLFGFLCVLLIKCLFFSRFKTILAKPTTLWLQFAKRTFLSLQHGSKTGKLKRNFKMTLITMKLQCIQVFKYLPFILNVVLVVMNYIIVICIYLFFFYLRLPQLSMLFYLDNGSLNCTTEGLIIIFFHSYIGIQRFWWLIFDNSGLKLHHSLRHLRHRLRPGRCRLHVERRQRHSRPRLRQTSGGRLLNFGHGCQQVLRSSCLVIIEC